MVKNGRTLWWECRTGLDHLYLIGYTESMNTILRTEVFDAWLKKLKDARGKARILERIRTAEGRIMKKENRSFM